MVRKTSKKAKTGRTAVKAKTKTMKSKAAQGGLAMASRDDDHLHDDNSICSCDFEFLEHDATADVELPPARGGLAGEKHSTGA